MERTISIERLEEIATMALRRLMEIDADEAQRFMVEEIDMSKEEVKYFGVARVRTVTDIDWDVDQDDFDDEAALSELPTRVSIPWNVFDDDIADWLSDEYGYCVNGFNVEEEDE